MAMEFPDARRGRALMKTVLPDDLRITSVGGIAHRGGPVIETPGFSADPLGSAMPPTPTPPCTDATAATTPFCIIQQWVAMERAADPADITPMDAGDQVPIVYVDRPAGQKPAGSSSTCSRAAPTSARSRIQFATDYGRDYTTTGASTSLLDNCGLGASPDIGRPDVKNDGDTVAFAGRASAAAGWRIYDRQHLDQGVLDGRHGATVGDGRRLRSGVVARRYVSRVRVDARQRQHRHRRDPRTAAPAVGYLAHADAERRARDHDGAVELRDQPALHPRRSHGDVDREGERQLLPGVGAPAELGSHHYHPLLAQREDSPYINGSDADIMDTYPSIGYSQATDIREEPDGNYDLILSTSTNGVSDLPGGAGALAIFNRSVGPFEADRSQLGFLQSATIVGSATATGYATTPNDRQRGRRGRRLPRTVHDARWSHHGVVHRVGEHAGVGSRARRSDDQRADVTQHPEPERRGLRRGARVQVARTNDVREPPAARVRRHGQLRRHHARDALHAGRADGVHGAHRQPATWPARRRAPRRDPARRVQRRHVPGRHLCAHDRRHLPEPHGARQSAAAVRRFGQGQSAGADRPGVRAPGRQRQVRSRSCGRSISSDPARASRWASPRRSPRPMARRSRCSTRSAAAVTARCRAASSTSRSARMRSPVLRHRRRT